MDAINHMWLFKFKLIKLKIQFLICLAIFQALNIWLVVTILDSKDIE